MTRHVQRFLGDQISSSEDPSSLGSPSLDSSSLGLVGSGITEQISYLGVILS